MSGTRRSSRRLKDVAVYKGDEFVCVGTPAECAKHMNISQATLEYYLSPGYARVLAKREVSMSAIEAFVLEDEDDLIEEHHTG